MYVKRITILWIKISKIGFMSLGPGLYWTRQLIFSQILEQKEFSVRGYNLFYWILRHFRFLCFLKDYTEKRPEIFLGKKICGEKDLFPFPNLCKLIFQLTKLPAQELAYTVIKSYMSYISGVLKRHTFKGWLQQADIR